MLLARLLHLKNEARTRALQICLRDPIESLALEKQAAIASSSRSGPLSSSGASSPLEGVQKALALPKPWRRPVASESIQIRSLFSSPETLPVAAAHLPSFTGLAGRGLVCRRHLHGSAGSQQITLGKHVREALANGQPVVALESTVITHGLPEPENVKLALSLEEIVSSKLNTGNGKPAKQSGAGGGGSFEKETSVTPATVGIVRGQLVVGLSREEIEFLASRESSNPIKASRRDIPIATALKLSAGTTVSATMALAASLRGSGRPTGSGSGSPIKVFATGGTGGVHKGGELSMDVSADLYEFARSPIGVVSSGFKSFLDTRRSLEFLETMGCPVVSMRGSCDDDYDDGLFPAFFTRSNAQAVKSPRILEGGAEEAARILFHCLEGPVDGRRAMLIANPIPAEFCLDKFCLDEKKNLESYDLENNRNVPADGGHDKKGDKNLTGLERIIASISAQIDKRPDLEGRDKTPLILERLAVATGNRTLRANMELLRNNAAFGAQLALEYARLASRTGCILPADIPSGVTFEGKPHLTLGGVGRNLACAIELLGHEPTFITALGNDNLASFALSEFNKIGLTPDSRRLLLTRGQSNDQAEAEASCCFALVLADSISGLSEFVVANLEAVRAINRQTIEDNLELIAKSPLVVMDANLASGATVHLIERCHERNVPIFLEPTDKLALGPLVASLKWIKENRPAECLSSLLCLSPNLIELEAMLELFGAPNVQNSTGQPRETLQRVEQLARKLMDDYLPQLRCLLVTLDKRGVLVAVRHQPDDEDDGDNEQINKIRLLHDSPRRPDRAGRLLTKHFEPPLALDRPVSASGAGDSFAAGFISGLLTGSSLEDCLAIGFQASLLTLQDKNNVSPKLRQIAIKKHRQV